MYSAFCVRPVRLGAFFAMLFLVSGAKGQVSLTRTFVYCGAKQTFTVPNCVTSVTADVRGAQGGGNGSAPGGLGGRSQAVITVTPGEVLEVWVGGAGIYTTATSTGGFNGGGSHSSQGLAGTGGGASDLRRGSGLMNRIIVAGGGGGGTDTESEYRAGGHGGGLNGNGGTDWSSWPNSGGKGGTQNSGGAAGAACCYSSSVGSFGFGGDGAGDLAAGGGGGGGWYGGGGGLFASGGGGSAYLGSPCLSNTIATAGYQPGNGIVFITYTVTQVNVAATPSLICAGSGAVLSAGGMMSYTWSTGANSASVSVSPSVATAYSLEATTYSSCPALGYATVNVTQGVPSMITQISASDICPGEYVTVNAAGADQVTWSGGVTNNVPFQPTATAVYTVTGQNVCGASSSSIEIYVHHVNFSPVSNPSSVCAGNAATLTAGGTHLTYTWTPFSSLTCSHSVVVSPAATTVYTVHARNDLGCTATKEFTLQVNPVPVLSVNPAQANVCKTNTLLLSAAGANSYTWMPGKLSGAALVISPHMSAVYKVTGANAAGCISTASTAVSVFPVPAVDVSATKTFVCAGTHVKLFASGATSYSWSNGQNGPYAYVTPTAPATYTVTGFNSLQCSSQKTIQVAVMQSPVSIPTSTSVCPDPYVSLYSAHGGSYTWDTGDCVSTITVKPLTGTWYSFSVTSHSNGITCTKSGSVQVTVLPSPTVTAAASQAMICAGEAITLSAGGASTYTWEPGGSGNNIVVVPSKHSYKYIVTGTDANGCTGTDAVHVKVNVCTGLDDQETETPSFTGYPNPNNGTFRILSEGDMDLYVVNGLGQVLLTTRLVSFNDHKVEITGLAQGVYLAYGKTPSSTRVIKILVE